MTEAAPGASPAVGLSQLRQHHLALMADPLKKASGQECESFVRDLIDAGRDVAPGRDREALRKMLYFWTAEAVNRGERPRGELPALLPYTGTAPAQPEKGALLTAPIGAEQIEATPETRAAIRIGALARQWRISGRDVGYLLNGDALKEAATLTGVDPEIDQFIEASRKRVRRQTIAAASFYILLLGAIAIAATVVAFYYRGLSEERRVALKDRETAFQTMSVANSRESAATRNEARAAIEALNAGGENSLGPLKKLLQRIGDAQSAELDNLAVKSTQAINPTSSGNIVQSPPQQVIQRTPPSVGTCDGVLWLGNDTQRLIAGAAPLASLQGNETIKVNDNANIRLRNGMPSAAYLMAPQIGLVPGGATLVLTGKPEAHRSPTGSDQYFAPVKAPQEFCTRVYVQYFGDSAKVQSLRTDLGDLGFEVPQAQKLDSTRQLAEVRIFQAADLPMAKLVGSTLKTFNNGKDLPVRELFNFPTKPAAGTIEVWIDLSGP